MGASELGQAYRKARDQLKREAPHVCAICGMWIDVELPRTDPMSWEADHIIPLNKGGAEADIANLQPSHKRCNGRKQDKPMRQHKGSRLWLVNTYPSSTAYLA